MAVFLFAGMLFGSQAKAQGRIDLNGAKSAQQCASSNEQGFTATFSFGSIESVNVNTVKGEFSSILMGNTFQSGSIGTPSLPAANKLIALPLGVTNVSVEVKNYSTTVYKLSDYGIKTLVPQQPALRKDQRPEDIPFAYDENAYNTRGYQELPIANFNILGTLRGIQVASLSINPVAYDVVNNTIKVYNDIEVEVSFGQYNETDAYNEFARTFSPYFANIYRQMFNWRDDLYDQHPDLWKSPVKMLVITDRMFEATIQNWVAWKTVKGFYMDVNYTDEIGTSTSAIKSFIQQKYEEDAPTFLVIIGDKNQVPASATGSETECVTDLYYMSTDGDEFPEMFHSRMPVETVSQLEAVLEKSLEYEQYTMPDPSYLNNVLLIAGDDNGWGVTVGRPAIWYASNYYYNQEHGFANVYEYSHGQWSGCYNHLNTGVGFANYTAHGSNTSWAGPQFTVNDVNNLTNEHKYFLAMGNCCQSNDWGISGTCFGEAMIRAEKKAAYAYIGSCPSTYWLNDYYFAVGATGHADGTMPSYEETTMGAYDAIWDDNAYNTVSAIPFIGNLASNVAQANGNTLHISTLYCWQAYHTLGDGSIMPFRVQPTANTISHMAIVPIGMSTYEVSAEPGSYVALSKDGVLHGAGMVDETGTIELEIEPFISGGNVTLCVTHPRHIPSIEEIPAAALEGAYITVNEYTPKNAHIGDESGLSITFKNLGIETTAGTTTVTLSCDNPNLTIINGTATLGILAPEETVELNGFKYQIAQGVADGTTFHINTTATCGSNTWEDIVNITAGKAVLNFDGCSFAGGFVPGGETAVAVSFKNIGHYMATNAVVSIASTSEYVTISNATQELGTIEPEGIVNCVFRFNVASNCPENEHLPFTFNIVADGGLSAEGNGILKNASVVIFELFDSYGDGWNGSKLHVVYNDNRSEEDLTITYGSQAVFTREINNGVLVTVTFIAGSWSYECSYTIKYEDGTIIHNGQQDNCDFIVNSGITPAFDSYVISASANPAIGGTVSGTGEYYQGETVTLTATPAMGYVFVNWTENNVEVSTSATYSFTATADRNLVANFREISCHWTPTSSLQNTMTVSGVIKINGIEQFSPLLEIGAFCGDECRGAQMATFFPPTEQYVIPISISGNENGDVISFRLFDHEQNKEIEGECSTMTFVVDAIIGSLGNWHVFDFQVPYIFEGSETDHNWSTPGNWNTGSLPTVEDNVIINAYCEMDKSATVASLTVSEGNSITVTDDMTMTVTGTLTTSDVSQLVIEDGGQLVNENNNVLGTVKKVIDGYGTSEDNWYMIASPITSNTNVTNLTANVYNLFTFNGSEVLEWRTQHGNPVINHKTGYLYANQENTVLAFTGTLAGTTDATILTLSDGGAGREFPGFNMIGNPYPCNAYITDSYLRMNASGNGFMPGTGAIAPCESVFVNATADGQTVTFSKTPMRISFASLTVTEDRGLADDRVIVRFDECYDLEKFMFNENSTKLYIPQNSKEFAVISAAINNKQEEVTTIPVNFKASEKGTYTLHFDMEDVSAEYLHLIDNLTGADVDLLAAIADSKDAVSYTFEAKPSDYAARFKLVFSMKGDTSADSGTEFAYINNGNLVIDHIDGQATLQIIDMLGHVLSTEIVSGSYNKAINMSAGLYIIRLNGMTQKIVVE